MNKFWWVNQKQTWKSEIDGGYLWSPKTEKGGRFSQFYENMKHVDVGDVIFSYFNTKIQYIGIATHHAVSFHKPNDFGDKATDWNNDGWLVSVKWKRLSHAIKPRSIFEKIKPYLPEKYSPLQKETGKGLQKLYLASVPIDMAQVLLREIGDLSIEILQNASQQDIDIQFLESADNSAEDLIADNTYLDATEKDALVKSRIGQGLFRSKVIKLEHRCRITGICDPRLLKASHIKPWRVCSNEERLDGNNGLLLSPNADHLFDYGFLSFEDDGQILLTNRIDALEFKRLGIVASQLARVDAFRSSQRDYLEYHRRNVFLAND